MPNEMICSEGPFEVELKVGIIDANMRVGVITVGMGHGKLPTVTELNEALKTSAIEAKERGFRLMTRREYITEVLGVGEIAIPGSDEFPNALMWQP